MPKRITGLTAENSPSRTDAYLAHDDASAGARGMALAYLLGDAGRIVNSEADLPPTTSGFHELEDNVTYYFGAAFECSDPIKAGVRNTFLGLGTRSSVITYNGTGTFITVTSTSLSVQMMSFDTPNAETFNCDATINPAGNPQLLTLVDVIVLRCDKIGTLNNVGLNSSSVTFLAADDGWSLVNSIFVLSMRAFAIFGIDATGIALDMGTAAVNQLFLTDGFITGTNIGISGQASSANMVSGAIGEISLVNFENITTPLSGVARDDFRYSFKGCKGVLDSLRAAETDLTTTQTVTISSTGVYVRVNGVNWTDTLSESFTINTAGEVTYIGEIDRRFKVHATSTLEKVGGGADEIDMRLGLDTGSGYTTEVRTQSSTQNSTPTSLSSKGTFLLSEGDKIATFVANASSTANIEVHLSNLDIFEIT